MQASRHPSLYFPDGDIALSAKLDPNGVQTTENLQIFRVHSFILKHHSTVFADMFSLPPPMTPPPDDTFDGVPLVTLADSASDLASLLDALYNPSVLSYKHFHHITPIVMRGILRLATKYQMGSLRTPILDRFVADWPRTLKEWDFREAEIAAFRQHCGDNGGLIDDHFPEPASAIKLAQEFDCQSVLPAAFYCVMRAGVDDDWDGIRSLGDENRPGGLTQTVRWGLLEQADLKHVLRIRHSLCSQINHILLEQYYYGKDCVTHRACSSARHLLSIRLLENLCENIDPLGEIDSCIDAARGGLEKVHSWGDEYRLCLSCMYEVTARGRERKAQIWSKLLDLCQQN